MITLDEARDRPTITVAEAAVVAGVGLRQMYEAISRGEIPVVRIGRRIFVKSTPFLIHLGAEPRVEPEEPLQRNAPLTVEHLTKALQAALESLTNSTTSEKD